MVTCNNLYNNGNMKQIASLGCVKVFEHQRDLSVNPSSAMAAYYAAEMNVRKRQVLIELSGNSFTVQAGAMQWMAGSVNMTSGIKGVGDFLGKAIASKVTKESSAKPEYTGNGLVGKEGLFNLCLTGNGVAVLESPVPKDELIEFDLKDDELKIDGNMAIAWSDSLKFTVERSSKSLVGSAVSGEGLVNVYRGTGRVLMAPTQ